MINRALYAIRNGWRHRNQLKAFLRNSNLQLSNLEHLSVEALEAANVAVVVLDFDGVLGHHDANQPTESAIKWLQALSNQIGEQRIAILTNKAKPERLAFFKKHFPSIQFVVGVLKKPYPNGLWEIANYRGIESSRLLLIDDRLLTGMLAACLAPCQARYFTRPVKKFRAHFIKESFFVCLRFIERMCFRGF